MGPFDPGKSREYDDSYGNTIVLTLVKINLTSIAFAPYHVKNCKCIVNMNYCFPSRPANAYYTIPHMVCLADKEDTPFLNTHTNGMH